MKQPQKGEIWKQNDTGVYFHIINVEKNRVRIMTRVLTGGDVIKYTDAFVSVNKFTPFTENFSYVGIAQATPEQIFKLV